MNWITLAILALYQAAPMFSPNAGTLARSGAQNIRTPAALSSAKPRVAIAPISVVNPTRNALRTSTLVHVAESNVQVGESALGKVPKGIAGKKFTFALPGSSIAREEVLEAIKSSAASSSMSDVMKWTLEIETTLGGRASAEHFIYLEAARAGVTREQIEHQMEINKIARRYIDAMASGRPSAADAELNIPHGNIRKAEILDAISQLSPKTSHNDVMKWALEIETTLGGRASAEHFIYLEAARAGVTREEIEHQIDVNKIARRYIAAMAAGRPSAAVAELDASHGPITKQEILDAVKLLKPTA